MLIKNPNELFKSGDDNRSRYLYVYHDGPQLESLEDWLDKYKGSIINNLEVQPYTFKYKNEDGEYRESMVSKVVLDVSIPDKYFYDVVDEPEDYLKEY